MSTLDRFDYIDPVNGVRMRAYADDRGFVQITLEHANGDPILAVRIRDDELERLIELLQTASDLAAS